MTAKPLRSKINEYRQDTLFTFEVRRLLIERMEQSSDESEKKYCEDQLYSKIAIDPEIYTAARTKANEGWVKRLEKSKVLNEDEILH